jgi:hypothetical protein
LKDTGGLAVRFSHSEFVHIGCNEPGGRDATTLRAVQAPLKERYKANPTDAYITLKARGTLDDQSIACKVETGRLLAVAGLHPATGGSASNSVPVTCCSKRLSPARACVVQNRQLLTNVRLKMPIVAIFDWFQKFLHRL